MIFQDKKREANYHMIKGTLDRAKWKASRFNDTELGVVFKATPETISRLRREEKQEDEGKEYSDIEKEDFLVRDEKGIAIKVSIDKVVEHLLKKYPIKTIFGTKTDSCYIFIKGFYSSNAREIISVESEKLLGSWCKNRIVDEIFKKIKRKTAISMEEFEQTPLHLIPFKNGLFDIKKNKLEPHNQNYYFKIIHPIDYIDESKCPLFKKWLSEMLPEEDQESIQELFGYCFYRKYFLKHFFIFVGQKDTGKTLLLSVLEKIIGLRNMSGLPLQIIASGDRMALHFLRNKTLNLYDDLKATNINDSGGIKMATGQSLITDEVKFGDIGQFYNYATMLFACNTVPDVKDKADDAYYERAMPFEFINRIPKSQQDTDLLEKLSVESPGIIVWAMQGLIRLLKNKTFSYDKTDEEVKRIMQSGDPLILFIEQCLVESLDGKITKDDMYEVYNAWAKDNKKTRFSKTQIGRKLGESCNFINDGSHGKIRSWKGALLIELDTLDTSKKNIRTILKEIKDRENKSQDIIHVISKKASKVSNQKLPKFSAKEVQNVGLDA